MNQPPKRSPTPVATSRQVWVLLVFDPTTGLATRPVGAVGMEGDHWHVSWLPLEPAADPWRERLHSRSGQVAVPQRLAWWAEHANGVTAALAPIDPPPAAVDLVGAVEAAVDALLCHDEGW